MLLTQEKKFFLQKASPSNIENAVEVIKTTCTKHEVEQMFMDDLLKQISGSSEKEYQEVIDESGIFYFFNDYTGGHK